MRLILMLTLGPVVEAAPMKSRGRQGGLSSRRWSRSGAVAVASACSSKPCNEDPFECGGEQTCALAAPNLYACLQRRAGRRRRVVRRDSRARDVRVEAHLHRRDVRVLLRRVARLPLGGRRASSLRRTRRRPHRRLRRRQPEQGQRQQQQLRRRRGCVDQQLLRLVERVHVQQRQQWQLLVGQLLWLVFEWQ